MAKIQIAILIGILFALGLQAPPARGGDRPKSGAGVPRTSGGETKEVNPAKSPLKLRLVANKSEYVLDLRGKTPAELREHIKRELRDGNVPPTPEIDLALEFLNSSDQEMKVWIDGDTTLLLLNLTGPGVVKRNRVRGSLGAGCSWINGRTARPKGSGLPLQHNEGNMLRRVTNRHPI